MARREPLRLLELRPDADPARAGARPTPGCTPQKAFDLLAAHVQKTEAHNTAGLMRRHIYQGFAQGRAARRTKPTSPTS